MSRAPSFIDTFVNACERHMEERLGDWSAAFGDLELLVWAMWPAQRSAIRTNPALVEIVGAWS